MKRLIFLSFCLLLILGIASFAQDVERGAGISDINVDNYIAQKEKLGLSKTQMEKLQEIKMNMGRKNAELVKQRTELNNELRDMMQEDEINFTKVEAKVAELEKARTQIMLNRLSSVKNAEGVLTKEQLEKMKKVRSQQRGSLKQRIEQKKTTK